MFKVDLDALKRTATCTRLMANSANSANRLTPEADSVSQLATLATLAISHGSHSDEEGAWAAAEVGKLLAAAMRACDHHNDSAAAREQMVKDCLDTPPELRQELLTHFERTYGRRDHD